MSLSVLPGLSAAFTPNSLDWMVFTNAGDHTSSFKLAVDNGMTVTVAKENQDADSHFTFSAFYNGKSVTKMGVTVQKSTTMEDGLSTRIRHYHFDHYSHGDTVQSFDWKYDLVIISNSEKVTQKFKWESQTYQMVEYFPQANQSILYKRNSGGVDLVEVGRIEGYVPLTLTTHGGVIIPSFANES